MAKFSPGTIERMRQKGRAQFADAAKRKAHGELTSVRMAALSGARASQRARDLARLCDAWSIACPHARARFLAELTQGRRLK